MSSVTMRVVDTNFCLNYFRKTFFQSSFGNTLTKIGRDATAANTSRQPSYNLTL